MSQCSTSIFFPLLLTSLILTLAGITAGVAASSLPAPSLSVFRRQATLTCGTELASTACDVKGFCCPTGTQCIPIENNTSVVCCKSGEYCDEILTVQCAASPSPRPPMASATVVANVTRCGSECCPLGYECAPEGNRCLLKAENIPVEYRLQREEELLKDREGKLASCLDLLRQTVNGIHGGSGGGFACKCRHFPATAIVAGLLPGLVLGVAIMFAYTKATAMKTRRRTINFNDPSPYDLSWAEPKPSMQECSTISSPLHPDQYDFRTSSLATRKPLTPADFSPNLGPVIPPRGNPSTRSGVVSRAASHTLPSPHRPASSLLESGPQSSPRSPSDSETEHSSESYQPSTITTPHVESSIQYPAPPRFHQHSPSQVTSVFNDSPAFDDDMTPAGGRATTPMTERLRGKRATSSEFGYTESIYPPSESTSQPFMFENDYPLPADPYESPFAEANPPARFGGF